MLKLVLAMLAAVLLSACAHAADEAGGGAGPVAGGSEPVKAGDGSYVLGTGDKLRVTVFGEADLSGQFAIDDTGFVRLPLIGQIAAAGRTVRQLEVDIATKLGSQYLKNPRVSIEVVDYRPFYIIGEVNKPGEYPYVSGMSVMNAIAMAGGYTYRANESSVYIKRKGTDDEQKFPADDTTKLVPGDIVNVVERWF